MPLESPRQLWSGGCSLSPLHNSLVVATADGWIVTGWPHVRVARLRRDGTPLALPQPWLAWEKPAIAPLLGDTYLLAGPGGWRILPDGTLGPKWTLFSFVPPEASVQIVDGGPARLAMYLKPATAGEPFTWVAGRFLAPMPSRAVCH